MFERYSKPLLSKRLFYLRVLRYAGFSIFLLGFPLIIGVVGYHFTDALSWLDSLVNASMILTGMGPVDPLRDDTAKWFASFYSIFSGVAFLSTVAVFLSPILHRFLHIHHLDDEQTEAAKKDEKQDEKQERRKSDKKAPAKRASK